ncbi:hypothetical protein [Cetobacterium sp.]|uniref:hypothetical protein n=1 Tax=Cetobacterium sp. TaxID=2071632 RepID=UPI003F2A4E9D
MDTIQIKLKLNYTGLTMEDFKRIEIFINHIKSPYGYTFCDMLDIRGIQSIGIKISYPRFFYGSNVFLISTKDQCFQVQRWFSETIVRMSELIGARIYLERVDIPFTYIMPPDYDFHSYNKLYGIMAMVHAEKRIRGCRKMYADILTQRPETLIYTDTKTPSSYNNKVMIYNQFLNMEAKVDSEETLDMFVNQYPDLQYRMRIEVSKKIRRNPFSIVDFGNFDMIEVYLPQLKETALENLLDFQIIDNIYQNEAIQLANILNIERQRSGFNYEVFILQNISKIYDYEILRRALGLAVNNTKTRESAVTAVRRHLNNYSQMNNIIVMDVYTRLSDIKKCIEQFIIF